MSQTCVAYDDVAEARQGALREEFCSVQTPRSRWNYKRELIEAEDWLLSAGPRVVRCSGPCTARDGWVRHDG
jgi:hypothetical protein